MKGQVLLEFIVVLAIAAVLSVLVLSISLTYASQFKNRSGIVTNSISAVSNIMNKTFPDSGGFTVIG